MASPKYQGQLRTNESGDSLKWPGTVDGFPIKGPVPIAPTQQDIDRIEHAYDYKAKLFQLWDPAQLSEYLQVMDKIVNGLYIIYKRDYQWMSEYHGYAVWVEWAQVYGMFPKESLEAS